MNVIYLWLYYLEKIVNCVNKIIEKSFYWCLVCLLGLGILLLLEEKFYLIYRVNCSNNGNKDSLVGKIFEYLIWIIYFFVIN